MSKEGLLFFNLINYDLNHSEDIILSNLRLRMNQKHLKLY